MLVACIVEAVRQVLRKSGKFFSRRGRWVLLTANVILHNNVSRVFKQAGRPRPGELEIDVISNTFGNRCVSRQKPCGHQQEKFRRRVGPTHGRGPNRTDQSARAPPDSRPESWVQRFPRAGEAAPLHFEHK
ncbi:hypothetical protein MRX96_041552 [Rhipicephalus microplus]